MVVVNDKFPSSSAAFDILSALSTRERGFASRLLPG
jgi:hypothetical protein